MLIVHNKYLQYKGPNHIFLVLESATCRGGIRKAVSRLKQNSHCYSYKSLTCNSPASCTVAWYYRLCKYTNLPMVKWPVTGVLLRLNLHGVDTTWNKTHHVDINSEFHHCRHMFYECSTSHDHRVLMRCCYKTVHCQIHTGDNTHLLLLFQTDT